MPRSRSKMLRTIPESPPTTPPLATRGTHLLANQDIRAPRHMNVGRMAPGDYSHSPPAWRLPNMDASTANGTTFAPAQDNDDPVIVSTPAPEAYQGFSAREELGLGSGADDIKPYVSHFLQVNNVTLADFEPGKPMALLKAMPGFNEHVNKLGVFDFRPMKIIKTLHTLYIFSDTLSFAKQMFDMLRTYYRITYTTRQGFADADVQIPSHVTRLSGAVSVVSTLKAGSSQFNFTTEQVSDMVKSVVARFGKIEEFEVLDTDWDTVKFAIEYDSANDANDAILNTHPGDDMSFGRHEHLTLHISNDEYEPEITPVTPGIPKAKTVMDPLTYSPTGRTAWAETPSGRTMSYTGYVSTPNTSRGGPGGSGGRHSRHHSRNHSQGESDQYVYQAADLLQGMEAYEITADAPTGRIVSHRPQDVHLNRIEKGLDVRTTLMVRNIPPEFTADDLVAILNDCVPGRFDFAYNRIDFRQNQAVGYAFVNFTTTSAVIDFVKRWRGVLLPRNVFRRHQKPCDVSYANIQGFECLVAKFRNSSILDEAVNCRPKLFWVPETAPHKSDVGKEREFPAVDNQAKKQRSIQNAHVAGLYTPRTRTNGRGRGRRGFSQFDRGTSAQQQDERQMGMNYQYGGIPMQQQGCYNFSQPRFPGLQYSPQPNTQYNMAYTTQYGPQYGPEVSSTPMPSPGSVLRTHTNGQLGPQMSLMPAYMAPVYDPCEVYVHHQGQFEPLLDPIKGQPARNFRRVM